MTHPEAARWAEEAARQREWGERTTALDEKGYREELCREVHRIGLILPAEGEHLLTGLLQADDDDVAAVNAQHALTEAQTRLQDLVKARDAVVAGVVEETVAPADELERLRAWKAGAVDVLGRWEQVWEAAGRPGHLGQSKADSVRECIEARPVSTPPSEDADEIRAEAVREAKRYIDSIHRNGLVPLGTVLADLEAAAYRMEQGMTARGSNRRRTVPSPPTDAEGGARVARDASGPSQIVPSSVHFAPYGSTNALCDETVPRSVHVDERTGEYSDERFTVKHDRTTCPACRFLMGLGPAPTEPAEEQTHG